MKQFERSALGILIGLGVILAILFGISRVIGMPDPVLYEQRASMGVLGPVGLTFAGVVDHASAESRIGLDDGGVPVLFKIEWVGDTILMRPKIPLAEGKTYNLNLTAGVTGEDGRTLQHALNWKVTVRQAQVVYLSTSKAPELWTASLDGKKTQLTHTGGKVNDYAVAPDGESLVYSVLNDQKGLDLWRMDRDGGYAMTLLQCAQDLCATPAFSADGQQLSYSRRNAGVGTGAAAQLPRVWIYDLVKQETHGLTADQTVSGGLAAWSTDGQWLAFRDDAAEGVRLVNLKTGEKLAMTADMGSEVEWSPDGKSLFFTRAIMTTDITYTAMMRFDMTTRQAVQLTLDDPEPADFSSPAISPQGDWLVAGTRGTVDDPARQLMLMRPDGNERTEITNDPVENHASYQWDGSGKRLVFQTLRLDCSCNLPQVMMWVRTTGVFTQVADDAIHPTWLP